jgi:hypothetical protein
MPDIGSGAGEKFADDFLQARVALVGIGGAFLRHEFVVPVIVEGQIRFGAADIARKEHGSSLLAIGTNVEAEMVATVAYFVFPRMP